MKTLNNALMILVAGLIMVDRNLKNKRAALPLLILVLVFGQVGCNQPAPSPTATITTIPSPTLTRTSTSTSTVMPSPTSTPLPTQTATPTRTPTSTCSPTPTGPTRTPTSTKTPTQVGYIRDRGWIEIYFINIPPSTQMTQVLIFHGSNSISRGSMFPCSGCYVLSILPNATIIIPREDILPNGYNVLQGADYEYLIEGIVTDKVIGNMFVGSYPVIDVSYFERTK